MTLEKNIKTLDGYLNDLDSSELDLNDAVDLYSKGVKLANKTLKQLEKAKLSVQELTVDPS